MAPANFRGALVAASGTPGLRLPAVLALLTARMATRQAVRVRGETAAGNAPSTERTKL